MDTSSPTDWLSPQEIEKPLRHLAGTDARVRGSWTVDQFKIGQGDGLGTWHVAGTMMTPAGEQAWSMVLKGWLCNDTPGSPSTYNWPWREAELYSSGILNDLPGVSAPVCFSSVQRDGSVWVWLEDLTSIPQKQWTLDDYARAGRRLGQFNGAYLAGTPLPVHQSLSRRWLEGWSGEGAEGLRMLDQYRDHALVQTIIPPNVEAGLVQTWHRRPSFLERLESMPQTFCHLDAFHANTFFRNTVNGDDMVLIDWSFAGFGAVGEELAALCMAGAIFDPNTPYSLEEIEQASFAAYIDGLRDTGWSGDEGIVWNTYRSVAILRYGLGPLSRMLPTMMNEQATAAFAAALGTRADRARVLLTRHYRWITDHANDV